MAVDDLWYLTKREPDGPDGKPGKRLPSKRHGRGKRYRVRWTDNTGQPRTQLFERKRDADNHDATIHADLSRGQYIDPAAGKTLLRTHAHAWLEAQTFDAATRQTIESRLNVQILPALGDRQLHAIKPSVVQVFIRDMHARGHSPNYVTATFSQLSTLLNAAVEDGLIPKNPCSSNSVRLPKPEQRRVAPWAIDRVMAVADALPAPYRATVYAGYGLGLRQGEILGLSVDDIDWIGRGRRVRIVRQIRIVRNTLVFAPPKGGRERDVPLSSETALRLSAHVKAYAPVAVTLPWREPEGRPVTVNLLFTRNAGVVHRGWFGVCQWAPALKAAGVPAGRNNGMHMLRHTFASTLLANGVDIRAVAEYLGHADPGFTLRTYTHLMPKTEDRARAAMDRAFEALPPAERAG